MRSVLLLVSRLLVVSILIALSAGVFFLKSTTPPSNPHILSIPYFSTKDGWNSTLTLNNSMPQPLTASVTLYSLDGSALPLSDFPLQPNQSIALRLNDLITQMRNEEKFAEGSIELRFTGLALGLGAQLTVSDVKRGLSFDMEPPMGFKSARLEGLWWSLDQKTRGQIMLSNTTTQDLDLLPEVEWHGAVLPARPISLSSHQTTVLEIEKLLKELNIDAEGIERGGLSLTHNGPPGALIAHGVIMNRDGHFASNLNFIDPAAQTSPDLEATGLLLSHPGADSAFPTTSFFMPILALKNASSSSQTATVTVQYKAGGKFQTTTLPAIELTPHQVGLADFSVLLDSLRDVSIDCAGLKVESSGMPGSIIATLSSIDQSSSLIVDAPLISVNQSIHRGGNYPLRLDEDFQTIVYLKNVGTKPTTAILVVRYDGGYFTPPLLSLDAGETVAIDLGQLRDNFVKDINGRTLPEGPIHGQVFWSPHQAEAVVGRAVVFDRSSDTASNFSCPTCCGTDFHHLEHTPISISGPFGATQQIIMYEYTYYCHQGPVFGPYNVTNQCQYSSNNPSAATVSTTGLVSCIYPGAATITMAFPNAADTRFDGFDCSTTYSTVNDSCGTEVNPTVTADGPVTVPLRSGQAGQNSITWTATGNPSGGTYSWSTTSTNVSLTNTTQATVTITSASASGARGDVQLQVIYTLNGQSGTGSSTLTVVKPTSLSGASDSTDASGHTCVTSTPTPSCQTSPCEGPPCSYTSYLRSLTYNVMDQFNPAQQISGFLMDIRESYTPLTGTCSSAGRVQTGSGSGSIVTDCFYFCSSTCASGGTCNVSSTQTITVNGFQVRTNAVNWTCSGVTVTGQ